jgi:hypothetical protein
MGDNLKTYGYEARHFRPKGTMKLTYLPTGKTEFLRMSQIQSRIKSGRLKPVEHNRGFIHAPTEEERLVFASIGDWENENQLVKGLTTTHFEAFREKITQHRNVYADWVDGDDNGNRAKFYAMAANLKIYQFDKEHKAWFMIQHDDGTVEYRFLNEATLRMLEKVVRAMFSGGDEFTNAYNDSEHDALWALSKWKRIGFEFMKDEITNPLDIRTVGFYPKINVGSDDLSEFGIYNSFDINNYKDNCVIKTFASVVNDQELNLLRSAIKTWRVDLSCLHTLSELFEIEIWVHGMASKPYPVRPKSRLHCKRKINVYVEESHMMIYRDDLKERLSKCEFRSMTNDEYRQAFMSVRLSFFEPLPYSSKCVRKSSIDTQKKFVDLKTWLDHPLMTEEGFNQFRKLMIDNFNSDPKQFKSLASFGFSLIDLSEVVELRGYVCEFIRKCQHPALCQVAHGVYPTMVKGELIQYDQNSSYPSTYKEVGIPIGQPSVIKKFEPSQLVAFFIRVDVKSFKCKLETDSFPLLKQTGVQYWDKIWFDLVMKYYEIEFEFLGGYSFKNVKPVLRDRAIEMFNLRSTQTDPCVRYLLKTVMNSWWGKSLAKQKPVYDKYMKPEKVTEFLKKNQLVYSIRKSKLYGDKVRVRLIKSLDLSYQRPQLGVTVLSNARKTMQDIIYNSKDVLYCNTDSLLTYAENKLPIQIGDGLGEFKIEYEAVEFICLGSKKKCLLLKDGSVKNTFGKRDVEWFRLQASVRSTELPFRRSASSGS